MNKLSKQQITNIIEHDYHQMGFAQKKFIDMVFKNQ
jgi:hypothetical protein